MGLRAALRALIRPQASENSITTSEDLEAALRDHFLAPTASSGVPVSTEAAQGLSAVASCVRVLSNSLAQLPLPLYRRDADGNREKARTDPLYGLLHDRPNDWQTSFQFRKLLMSDLLYRGNAYAYKLPGGMRGRPTQLVRLHPDRTTPKQDPQTLAISYEFRRRDGRVIVYSREEVLHIWADSEDGLVGINPIRRYRETVGDGLALRQHGSKFFANGAKLLGVLEPQEGAKINAETGKAILQDFESMYAGGENAHRTALLPNGLTYKPVGISMEDAQYIEARKFNRAEIAGIFGVPLHKIGDLDRATFSNIEHQALEFVTDSLMPWLVCWEQALNRDLLGDREGFYFKHTVAGLMRGDFKSRQEGLQIMRRNGVIHANEWRATEDFNKRTDAGAEEYIVETNMRPQDGRDPDQQEAR